MFGSTWPWSSNVSNQLKCVAPVDRCHADTDAGSHRRLLFGGVIELDPEPSRPFDHDPSIQKYRLEASSTCSFFSCSSSFVFKRPNK
jgi:hypothetical protein